MEKSNKCVIKLIRTDDIFRIFINVFSRVATDFHTWAKLFITLNFFVRKPFS